MHYQGTPKPSGGGGLLKPLFGLIPVPKGKRGKGGKQAAKKKFIPAATLFGG